MELWNRVKAGIFCFLWFMAIMFAGLLFVLAIIFAAYYESLWWLLLWLAEPVPFAVGMWALEKASE